MAQSKKASGSRAGEAEWSSRLLLNAALAVILVSALAILFRFCQLSVDRHWAFPNQPPKVVLANRPAWMADSLADQIIKLAQPIGLHSSFDRQLLVDTSNALQTCPWIRRVNQIRRAYSDSPGDTLEVDCEYRTPIALVQWGDYYWLVDSDGVQLPEQYTDQQVPRILFNADGSINLRVITGVAHAPSVSGRTWPGADLAAGLELAKLLAGQTYAQAIRQIDVSNYSGRVDSTAAQLLLKTEFGTEIRWGRAPSAPDAFVEVPATTKLAFMEAIYAKTKRVDANQPWVDLRFDHPTIPVPAQVPAADSSAASATANPNPAE